MSATAPFQSPPAATVVFVTVTGRSARVTLKPQFVPASVYPETESAVRALLGALNIPVREP